MIRGVAGLSVLSASAFVLYLEAFLGGLPWYLIAGAIVGVGAGIWLMGTRGFG